MTLYVANQKSKIDFLKSTLVCQQCPSKSLFRFCSVHFDPGEDTTFVPPEELVQADIGTNLVQCRNYFWLVNHGGPENLSFQK